MKRFKNILYVADSSGIVLRAFHHAVRLAERNRARLTVVLVTEALPTYLARLAPNRLGEVRAAELQAALDKLAAWAKGRVEIETKVLHGTAFLEVVREVLRHGRDLVIKSVDRNDGAANWAFVSADMHLLRKCPCPVWLIKPEGPTPIRRVMACVDFNDFDPQNADSADAMNRMILEMAGSLARSEDSDLHLVHAWEAIGESLLSGGRAGIEEAEVEAYVHDVRMEHHRRLDQLLRTARTWPGFGADAAAATTHLPKGRAAEVIPELAETLQIDLIVMGTIARSGIPGFLIGNTAETVLSRIHCSVLAVKPPDFVTPVTLED